MLTGNTLYDTLMSLSNYREYREGSLGYLPFLLHTKWEQDNGNEQKIDFTDTPSSVIFSLQRKYQNDNIGKMLYVAHSNHKHSGVNELPDEPSGALLAYALQTINTLDLSEKNLKRGDLIKAFYLYLSTMSCVRDMRFREDTDTQKVIEEVIQKITADTETVYDPFCADGYALGMVNAKETHGSEGNSVLSLIAKIRLDFMGRNADIKSVSAAEHPEITPEGKLKTYPFVISCLDSTSIRDGASIVSRDIYNRFSRTVQQSEARASDEEPGLVSNVHYTMGITLGHALAVSTGRCILFSNLVHWNPNILFDMDQDQITSFIHSDVLEAVLFISGDESGRRFRRKMSTIYIFNKKKDEKHRGKVFFLNANTRALSSDDIVRIYRETEEIEGVSKLVPLTQISENRRDCLSAVRYTAVIEKQNTGSLSSILHELRRLEERGNLVMSDILQVAHSLSIETSGRRDRFQDIRRP